MVLISYYPVIASAIFPGTSQGGRKSWRKSACCFGGFAQTTLCGLPTIFPLCTLLAGSGYPARISEGLHCSEQVLIAGNGSIVRSGGFQIQNLTQLYAIATRLVAVLVAKLGLQLPRERLLLPRAHFVASACSAFTNSSASVAGLMLSVAAPCLRRRSAWVSASASFAFNWP